MQGADLFRTRRMLVLVSESIEAAEASLAERDTEAAVDDLLAARLLLSAAVRTLQSTASDSPDEGPAAE